jgi:flagellar M-ring protein FliF
MSALLQPFRNLGPQRLFVLAAVSVGFVVLILFLTTRLTSPNMTLLYGDLELADSSSITTKLDAMSVPYEIRGNGSQILVPSEQVGRLRMAMAAEGLPGGGSVGYEIFDRSEALGTTSFVQNINQLRALEGELARTISSLTQIHAARVHLVLPRRQLFSRDRQEPTASIVLTLRGTQEFAKPQARAIQNLVAAAVPGLLPSRISIIDSRGNLLARAASDDDEEGTGTTAEEMRIAHETRLARTIKELLERTVGPGNVRAEVSVEMDFDRITTNSEAFDPDGQVVRSTQTVEETASSTDSGGEDPVTVAQNLPDAANMPFGGAMNRSDSTRTEETVNYEVSRKSTIHVRESGETKKISAAVLVDGTYTTADDGTQTYHPRSTEEMAQLTTLVRTAIGYDEARGDHVQIINLQFARVEGEAAIDELPPLFGLTKHDYLRIAETLVLGIVAVLVILLVLRPLVRRLFEVLPAPGTGAEEAQRMIADQSGGGAPALAAPPGALATAGNAGSADGAASADGEDTSGILDAMVNLDRVEGQVKESTLNKIGKIVEDHPDEVATVVRNWMYQES